MSSSRLFQVTEESWGNHYHVTTDNGFGGERHLFIENNPFASKPSDIAIHEGPDIEGPVLGVSKFHRFSQNCDIKMGEHVQKWTRMVKKGLISPSYSFQMEVQGQSHQLVWKRTRSLGAGASAYGNSKLVDEESQDVLAVFSSDPRSLVTGNLDVYGNHDDAFDQVVLLTGLVFREKHRRQTVRTARAGRDDIFITGGALGGAGGASC